MTERKMTVIQGNQFKIIRVPIPTPTLLPHTTTNGYIIGNERESILIDAGYDQPETRKELDQAIQKHGMAVPHAIILTHSHPDHAPGVRQLFDWNPVVYCHQNEEQPIISAISPWDKVSFLNDGDLLQIAGEEIQVIHAPGHTSGGLNLYIPSLEILLSGDNIVAEGTSWIGPPDGDMSDYFQTLNRLKQLKLKKIGPGHGGWIDQPYDHIEFVIQRRLLRESQIVSLLKEHEELTAVQLTNMIYQELPHPSVFEVARRTTEAHLIKLIKEGSVIQQESMYQLI
jgi:endoribonuclease LACTB2